MSEMRDDRRSLCRRILDFYRHESLLPVSSREPLTSFYLTGIVLKRDSSDRIAVIEPFGIIHQFRESEAPEFLSGDGDPGQGLGVGPCSSSTVIPEPTNRSIIEGEDVEDLMHLYPQVEVAVQGLAQAHLKEVEEVDSYYWSVVVATVGASDCCSKVPFILCFGLDEDVEVVASLKFWDRDSISGKRREFSEIERKDLNGLLEESGSLCDQPLGELSEFLVVRVRFEEAVNL